MAEDENLPEVERIEKIRLSAEIHQKIAGQSENQQFEAVPKTIIQTDKLVITTAEVSGLLGVAPITLHRWRKNGSGPPWRLINGKIFYHKEGFCRWFDSQFGR